MGCSAVILCCVPALIKISCCGIPLQNVAAFGKLSIQVHMQGMPLVCESVSIVHSMSALDHSVLLRYLRSIYLRGLPHVFDLLFG